jgi:hypothetical protein
MDVPDDVVVGDFLQASSEADVTRGIYRVVGVPDDGDELVLLRVTDEHGRRANTGELVRVDADAAASLDAASEPSASVAGVLRNVVQGPYWLLRSLLRV